MQLSFRLGVIFILLAAAAWGLGGVAGQFLFQFYDVGAPWLIAVRQIIAGVVFLGYLLCRGENISGQCCRIKKIVKICWHFLFWDC